MLLHPRGQFGDTCTELGGVVIGFMLSAGATFEDALKGFDFAQQHDMWIKKTARRVPCEGYFSSKHEDDEDDGAEKRTTLDRKPDFTSPSSFRTVYDCTFVG